MLGPILAYNDLVHLEQIIEVARGAMIIVWKDDVSDRTAIWFGRGWGKIQGLPWSSSATERVIHLAFGHPCNPFLWYADKHLSNDLERIFIACGARLKSIVPTNKSDKLDCT